MAKTAIVGLVRVQSRLGRLRLNRRTSDRGRRVVVGVPRWIRRGVSLEDEQTRRVSAVVLYAVFAPLAAGVELAYGAWHSHPALLVGTTAFLVAQALFVWSVRPMPMRGWLGLAAAVPVAYALYVQASPPAGEALSTVLVVPIGWAATFLPGRFVAVSAGLNIAAVATLVPDSPTVGALMVFLVRSFTFLVIAIATYAVVSGLRRARQAAQRRADTDRTTLLLSRARMLDLLAPIVRAGGAESDPMGILLIDVDHFKQVNDTYGHLAGDQALRQIGRTLQRSLREQDLIARWGGEEFLVAAPGVSDGRSLVALAEKVRTTIAAETFLFEGREASLSVSIGAVLAEPPTSLRALVAAADDALYQAKKWGRNRTELAHPKFTRLTVPATPSNLALIRRAVREAATRAGLTERQVIDVTVAASEACGRLLLQAPGAPLQITTHDRDHQFAVSVSDQAPIDISAPETDALDVAILTHLADYLEAPAQEGDGEELTLVFRR